MHLHIANVIEQLAHLTRHESERTEVLDALPLNLKMAYHASNMHAFRQQVAHSSQFADARTVVKG